MKDIRTELFQLLENEFAHDESLSPQFQDKCAELFSQAVVMTAEELLVEMKSRKPKNWFSKTENRVTRMLHEKSAVCAGPMQEQRRIMARRAAAIGRMK